jgi:hypothetical protein
MTRSSQRAPPRSAISVPSVVDQLARIEVRRASR